ncbi:hypothetical protein BH10CHL1_BH10CHL1_05610 [soil metagenome]
MALFNHKLIQKVTALIHEQQQSLRTALGQPPLPEEVTRLDEPSPLHSDLHLLIQVANGEYSRTHATAKAVERIELALQNLLALLLGNPLHYPVTIPDDFWQTEIGILVSRVRWWISADDLITISNAAALAFGENTQANRMRITRAMDKGQLAWIPDPSMMNPQQNKRVLRPQVEQLRDQRQLPE